MMKFSSVYIFCILVIFIFVLFSKQNKNSQSLKITQKNNVEFTNLYPGSAIKKSFLKESLNRFEYFKLDPRNHPNDKYFDFYLGVCEGKDVQVYVKYCNPKQKDCSNNNPQNVPSKTNSDMEISFDRGSIGSICTGAYCNPNIIYFIAVGRSKLHTPVIPLTFSIKFSYTNILNKPTNDLSTELTGPDKFSMDKLVWKKATVCNKMNKYDIHQCSESIDLPNPEYSIAFADTKIDSGYFLTAECGKDYKNKISVGNKLEVSTHHLRDLLLKDDKKYPDKNHYDIQLGMVVIATSSDSKYEKIVYDSKSMNFKFSQDGNFNPLPLIFLFLFFVALFILVGGGIVLGVIGVVAIVILTVGRKVAMPYLPL